MAEASRGGQEAGPGPAELVDTPHQVKMSTVINVVVHRAQAQLVDILNELPTLDDANKKKKLLKYLYGTRSLLIRVLVLLKWSKNQAHLRRVWELSSVLNERCMQFDETTNKLLFVHQAYLHTAAPEYDIPTAIDVLSSGTYPRLPRCIEQGINPSDEVFVDDDEEAEYRLNAMERVGDTLRVRLLNEDIPKRFDTVSLKSGYVLCRVSGEFEINLTVTSDDMESPWRVLSVKLFVVRAGEKDSTNKNQALFMRDYVQSKLAAAPTGTSLRVAYDIVHGISEGIVMEYLNAQGAALKTTMWAGPLVVDYVSQSKLTVTYWNATPHLDFAGLAGKVQTNELAICSGVERTVDATHTPGILDPASGSEVLLEVNPGAVSLEDLFIRAVQLNCRMRIDALYKHVRNRFSQYPCAVVESPDDPRMNKCVVFVYHSAHISFTVDLKTGLYALSFSLGGVSDSLASTLNRNIAYLDDVLSHFRKKAILMDIESIALARGFEVFWTVPGMGASAPGDKDDRHQIFLRFMSDISSENSVAVSNAGQRTELGYTKKVEQWYICIQLTAEFSAKFCIKGDQSGYMAVPESEGGNGDVEMADDYSAPLSGNKRKWTGDGDLPSVPSAVLEEIEARLETCYESAVNAAVERCQKFITYLDLKSQLENMSIPINPHSCVIDLLNVQCPPLRISSVQLRVVKESDWEVLVSHDSPPFDLRGSDPYAQMDVRCKQQALYFRYSKVHANSAMQFLEDLKGAARMASLAMQLRRFEDNRATEFEKMSHDLSIKLVSLTCIEVEMMQGKISVSIRWKGRQGPYGGYVAKFTGVPKAWSHYFLAQLNEGMDIIVMLWDLYWCHQPMQILDELISGGTTNADDITLIPSSASCIKLIYRNTFAVNLRVFREDGVWIEDMTWYRSTTTTPSPTPDPANTHLHQTELTKIPSLMKVLSKYFVRLDSANSTAAQNRQVAGGLVNHASFKDALNATFDLIGKILLYHHMNATVSLLKDHSASAPQNERLHYEKDSRGFVEFFIGNRFIAGMNLGGQSQGVSLEIKLSKSNIAPPFTQTQFSEEDSKFLLDFFRDEVASRPYQPSQISAFVHVLTLPESILAHLVPLIRGRDYSRDGVSVQACVSLKIPSRGFEFTATPLEHNFKEKRLRFLVKITLNRKDVKIIPLAYNYSQKAVSVWGDRADARVVQAIQSANASTLVSPVEAVVECYIGMASHGISVS